MYVPALHNSARLDAPCAVNTFLLTPNDTNLSLITFLQHEKTTCGETELEKGFATEEMARCG